jgi:hypothetical protein
MCSSSFFRGRMPDVDADDLMMPSWSASMTHRESAETRLVSGKGWRQAFRQRRRLTSLKGECARHVIESLVVFVTTQCSLEKLLLRKFGDRPGFPEFCKSKRN